MKILLLFAILSSGSISIFSQRNDWQSWNEAQLFIPLVKAKDREGSEFDRISLFITGSLRFGRNWQALVDELIGFGFDLKINDLLTLTPSYIHRTDRGARERRNPESRYRFAATLEKKFSKFTIKDRNLIEFRDRQREVENSARYRNRITFTMPINKKNNELFAPFFQNEVFYDITARAWSRNDISFGVSKQFKNCFSVESYYLYRRDRPNTLKNVSLIGINLKFRIQ